MHTSCFFLSHLKVSCCRHHVSSLLNTLACISKNKDILLHNITVISVKKININSVTSAYVSPQIISTFSFLISPAVIFESRTSIILPGQLDQGNSILEKVKKKLARSVGMQEPVRRASLRVQDSFFPLSSSQLSQLLSWLWASALFCSPSLPPPCSPFLPSSLFHQIFYGLINIICTSQKANFCTGVY